LRANAQVGTQPNKYVKLSVCRLINEKLICPPQAQTGEIIKDIEYKCYWGPFSGLCDHLLEIEPRLKINFKP